MLPAAAAAAAALFNAIRLLIRSSILSVRSNVERLGGGMNGGGIVSRGVAWGGWLEEANGLRRIGAFELDLLEDEDVRGTIDGVFRNTSRTA